MQASADLTLRLPATSANLGPGFDTLGIAMTLHNDFHVRVAGTAHRVTNQGHGVGVLDNPADNLFFRAYEITCLRHHLVPRPLEVLADNRIPLQSGIGSSATAVVAGVAAAYAVHGLRQDRHAMLIDALALEGHPDNLSACLYGGFTVAVLSDGGPVVTKTNITYPLQCWVVHPDRVVDTAESRSRLPVQVSMQDAVYSLSRATLLTAALIKGEMHLLYEGMRDRLHEPLRMDPHMEYPVLKEKLRGAEFFGWAVSGSGPSVVIFCSAVSDRMRHALATHFAQKGVAYDEYHLQVDNRGLQIRSGEACEFHTLSL